MATLITGKWRNTLLEWWKGWEWLRRRDGEAGRAHGASVLVSVFNEAWGCRADRTADPLIVPVAG
jgi:hypothetical protein